MRSTSNRRSRRPRRPVVRFIQAAFGLLTLLSIIVAGSVILRHVHNDSPADRAIELPASTEFDGWVTVEEILGVSGATYHEGRWFVADSRTTRIHVVDTLGRYRFGFGRKGRGPGEFMAPSAVAVTAGQLHVAELTRPVVQVFDLNGHYLRRTDLRDPDCTPGSVVTIAGVANGLVALQRCVVDRTFRHRVRWVDARGSARWLDVEFPDVAGSTLPAPVLGSDGEARVVMGDGQRGCLRILTPPHEVGPLQCPELPRAPLSAATREKIARRFDIPGAPVRVTAPDSLPLFDLIAWTPVLSIRHPTTEKSHIWLVLDQDTNQDFKPGPGVHSIFSGGKYLAARELTDGTALTFSREVQ